jgi:cobaltochelatase CobS
MSQNTVTKQEIQYLVSFFNSQHASRFRFETEDLLRRFEYLGSQGWTVSEIKSSMRNFADGDIRKYLDHMDCQARPVALGEIPVAMTIQTPVSTPDIAQSLGILEKAMAEIFMQTKADEISKSIMGKVEGSVRDFVASEYGTINRKVVIEMPERKVEFDEQLHEKFEEVLSFIKLDEPVFMCGPAGSGKNVICKQIAKALDLDFYFSNAVTQEYKITGFTDAMGVFHESQFYKAFKNGGLFLLDEIDGSIPEVLIILNAAIANRYFDFPAPIGYTEAHKDFRIISAGNTFGHGASYQYVGRNQLDMASLDRFAVIEIDYSKGIEEACADGNKDLVNFIRDFRHASEKSGVNVIASYRSITRISKMETILGIEKTLKSCLLKNLEVDDLKMILSNMRSANKYKDSMFKISEVR